MKVKFEFDYPIGAYETACRNGCPLCCDDGSIFCAGQFEGGKWFNPRYLNGEGELMKAFARLNDGCPLVEVVE